MRPIFFGESSQQLYGVLQEPTGSHFADYAVLICYPFGQEYMRGHRACRQLASLLARNGVASLRFDYYGSGDSAGDGAEFSLQRAQDDCRQAFAELQRQSAVERIHVVGLRMGAMFAASALGSRNDIRGLVFWDAVTDGQTHLQELRATIDETRLDEFIIDDTWWVNGFPVSPSFRADISELKIPAINLGAGRNILQLVSRSDPSYEQVTEALQAAGHRVEHRFVPGVGDDDWQHVDDQGSLLMPHQSIRTIVEHILTH